MFSLKEFLVKQGEIKVRNRDERCNFLTVKFWASFVLTGREVRELHPVSRHVRYHFSGQATLPPTRVPRFHQVVWKYPVTSEHRGRNCVEATASPSVCVGVWESFTAQASLNTASTGGDPSVIDFPFLLPPLCVSVCSLCVCWLCASTAVKQLAQSTHLPPCLIVWSETHWSSKKHFRLFLHLKKITFPLFPP